MTVGQWFEKFGDGEMAELIHDPEGDRGEVYLEALDDNKFGLSQTDKEFSETDPDYPRIFDAEDEIRVAIDYWLDAVAYSAKDREKLVAAWKQQYKS